MSGSRIPATHRPAGIITAAELLASGVSRGETRRLVRENSLRVLGRGVFAPAQQAAQLACGPAGEEALRLAATLAMMGPGYVGSHHTAAILQGLDLLRAETTSTLALTRCVAGAGSRTGRAGVRVHVAALPPEHVTASFGVPLTSVARTVADLARTASFRAGVVAADSALRHRRTSKPQLESVLAACAQWPGIQRARQAVAFSDPRSESAFESVARVAFRDHGLPAPDLQAWVGSDDEVIGRTDFLWRAYRTIGEADGAIKYADPSRARVQLHRDALLRDAGFEVVHFTWEEIMVVPGQVAAALRRAFVRSTRPL